MGTNRATQKFRTLMKKEEFIFMPVAYDPIGGRLIESLGFKATYTGGFVTGGSRCITEPMVNMMEQVNVARDVAKSVNIPLLADGGAGFGEPMHTMRTDRAEIDGMSKALSSMGHYLVLVFCAEAITDPTADRWLAHENGAGVHLVD